VPVPASPGTEIPWIWFSGARVDDEAAIEAAARGAYDVVSLRREGSAARLATRVEELSLPLPPPRTTPLFGGKSAAARRTLARIAQAARTSMPVLLTGETGTGKEVVARLVHSWSSRSRRRFVPINCAAIPDELMESELFGYVRGAFSGAVAHYEGQLMAAAGGTVFLDEIDDTPASLQVKLLRVLEDRVVSRLGENEWHQVDFRIVAATNRDLLPLIEAGSFGADLYERLAIVSIHLPALRERLEDLPLLVEHFIERFYAEEPRVAGRARVSGASDEALAALARYPWPGNVRELRNVVFGALVYKRAGEEILLSDLPRRVLLRGAERSRPGLVDPAAVRRVIAEGKMNLRLEVEDLERIALSEALAQADGNATRASKLLGEVGRGASSDPGGTVRGMMKRLGIPSGRRR
jgi:transcriptional regulator with PAS, ATPase and Fis domain